MNKNLVETKTGVVIYSELEEQVQIDELTDILSKGYNVFTPLGGGVVLLTTERLKLSHKDASVIYSKFRFNDGIGSKYVIALSDNEKPTNLEIHICKILDL